jgi:TonB family protein
MRTETRRRHILFFSTSLAAHCLIILILVGVSFIVSDTLPVGADRPLVVSLSGGGAADDTAVTDTPRERTSAPRTESGPHGAKPADESGGAIPAGDPGGISRTGTTGGGADTALLSDYIERIHVRINRYKRYPPGAARDGVEGTVTVSFLLNRHGALLEKRIVAGSGHPVLDEAALAAVADASPFPPFPDGLGRETMRLRLPINYKHQ